MLYLQIRGHSIEACSRSINGNSVFPVPKEAYLMDGVGGQNMFMIPPYDLAVVRKGDFKGVGANRPTLKKSLGILMKVIPAKS